jgi:hypothetical protein
MHCRASHTVPMLCIAENPSRKLHPLMGKTAHRGVAGRCHSASGKTRLQAMMPSGKNSRRATTARQTHLLPQTVPKTTCPSGFGGTIARFLNEVGQGGMDDGNTLMQAGFMTAGSGVIIAAAGGGGANPAADLLGGAFITGGGALTALGTINWGLGYAVKGVGALLSAALGNTQPMKSTIVQGAQSGLEDRLGIPPGAPSPLDPLGEKLAGTNPCP